MNIWANFFLSLAKAFGYVKPTDGEEPKLKPTGTITASKLSLILKQKLRELKDDKADRFYPDRDIKTYDKQDVKDFLHLDETSEIKYIAEEMDCDDFAAEIYGKFAGLIWTTKHALNWFIDETLTFWFIEPQTDKLSKKLKDWQDWDVRFFLGR